MKRAQVFIGTALAVLAVAIFDESTGALRG
jgi:hypothetical protein